MQFAEIGSDGLFTAAELVAAIKPRGHLIFPPTTLVEVENTQNRAGGVVWDPAELRRIGAAAREYGIASYLDGARLLNAAVARGDDPAALAEPFDLVTIAMSKGLGGPAGLGAWPAARRTSRRSCATAGCSAARCARRASSPPPASTRSSTTSSASPTTT